MNVFYSTVPQFYEPVLVGVGIAVIIISLALFIVVLVIAAADALSNNKVPLWLRYSFSVVYCTIAVGVVLVIWGKLETPRMIEHTTVEAKMIDVYSASVQTGKHSFESRNFIRYDTPDGVVVFKIVNGEPWPKVAVLYRNVK